MMSLEQFKNLKKGTHIHDHHDFNSQASIHASLETW